MCSVTSRVSQTLNEVSLLQNKNVYTSYYTLEIGRIRGGRKLPMRYHNSKILHFCSTPIQQYGIELIFTKMLYLQHLVVSYQKTYEVGCIIIPIFTIRKLMPREEVISSRQWQNQKTWNRKVFQFVCCNLECTKESNMSSAWKEAGVRTLKCFKCHRKEFVFLS